MTSPQHYLVTIVHPIAVSAGEVAAELHRAGFDVVVTRLRAVPEVVLSDGTLPAALPPITDQTRRHR